MKENLSLRPSIYKSDFSIMITERKTSFPHNLLIGIIQKPYCLYSIKSIKKSYFDENMYYDLYNDYCNSYLTCNNQYECLIDLNQSIIYKKYSSLTAEHIFPQSFIKEYKNAYLDMHNIYLTNSITNSHRNNYKYIDENIYNKYYKNEKLLTVCKNNFKNTKYKFYIPCINIRGLIARSIAYMKYTYPKLNIHNVISSELIIKWNFLYPPTQLEFERNEIIKSIQGNYNPFISNYNKTKYLIILII
tara:strand:- start:1078 stop:1815 length:738 start_codon:yes stop_codon:yes gene_type:complete